jgi:methyltransferase family protein
MPSLSWLRRSARKRPAWASELSRLSRPVRRTLAPRQFKETYINEALSGRRDTLYVEIGVRDGECLRQVRADRKIAVDPLRTPNLMTLTPEEVFFERKSDDFFTEDAPKLFAGLRVDVALIDGWHEFTQALRDILNMERYMRSDGVIFIDDCNPPSEDRAGQPTGGPWSGDVWKVAPFLRTERPDLQYRTLAAGQGIGVLWGFGAQHPDPPADTIAKYKAMPYSDLANDRTNVLALTKPRPLGELMA